MLNRGSDSFCSQGLYGLGRGETLTFQSLTGLGKRRAVQINAMYNKSENCQNWVFTFTVKLKLYFFFFVKKFTGAFFFPFRNEFFSNKEMRLCLEMSKNCPMFKQRGFAMGISQLAQ